MEKTSLASTEVWSALTFYKEQEKGPAREGEGFVSKGEGGESEKNPKYNFDEEPGLKRGSF